MSEDYALQVSLKAGAAMVNVRASDPDELDILLAQVGERTGQVASLQAELDAAYRTAAGLGKVGDVSSQGSGAGVPDSDAPGPAPHCAHGARVYVNGKTQKGVSYEAWDCPDKGRGGCPQGQDRTFISYNGKPSGRR